MAQMVQNKAAPWINSWNILINNWQANPSYNPSPVSIATRGSGCNPGDNSRNLMNDAAAAYQLALRWKITGNNSYADAAVKIMNAWSSTLTQISCGSGWDFVLMAGIQGYQFANAGEIMRNYSGLSAANFTAFQKMMSTVFYPWPSQGWLPNTDLTVYSSWDLLGIAAGMAIGVLCDNQTIFNQAINNFYFAYGNGGIHNMVYYVHPGYLGQTQESG
uniref:Alginate lyase domain-containing protein n=1 Tax=Acrobeloides nanus TaxID=290746 RepID=A0A914CR62_9BILA